MKLAGGMGTSILKLGAQRGRGGEGFPQGRGGAEGGEVVLELVLLLVLEAVVGRFWG